MMERASFSLERQAPARTRTFILSTLREMEGLQGQQPCALSIFLVEYSLCCVSSHYLPRTIYLALSTSPYLPHPIYLAPTGRPSAVLLARALDV